MQHLIDQINAEIASKRELLATAKQAAAEVPTLEAELAKLEGAKKHLSAPQTPAGRQRIAEGQRRRKKKAEAEPTEAAPIPEPPTPLCSECHRPGRATEPCAVDGCDARICAYGHCGDEHEDRWHLSAVAASS